MYYKYSVILSYVFVNVMHRN